MLVLQELRDIVWVMYSVHYFEIIKKYSMISPTSIVRMYVQDLY